MRQSDLKPGLRVLCGTITVPATVGRVLVDGAMVIYDDEPGREYPVAAADMDIENESETT